MTKIEWADESWNPITGCTPVGPGCDHCYARRMAQRLRGRCGYPADEPFMVTLHPERLGDLAKWRKPRNVFVCSMGDLFHDDAIGIMTGSVLDAMDLARHHNYILLTKRPGNMARLIGMDWGIEPRPNWFLGFSAWDQASFDSGWAALAPLAAAGWRIGCSLEPMLGAVDFRKTPGFNLAGARGQELIRNFWVILGGETGPGARPIPSVDAVRAVRDQCEIAGVPFMFKRWGWWGPDHTYMDTCRDCGKTRRDSGRGMDRDGEEECSTCGGWIWIPAVGPVNSLMHDPRVRDNGRLLDGRTHDETAWRPLPSGLEV